jgi:hypothetical protein
MKDIKNIVYALIGIAIILTVMVAFHVVSPDNVVIKDYEKVFYVETGVDLEPIEEALGKP